MEFGKMMDALIEQHINGDTLEVVSRFDFLLCLHESVVSFLLVYFAYDVE